jgi:fatty acid desaturase
MTWLTNGNNFHVEHHLMPGLPIDRLHDLHAVIAEDLCHCYPSYRAFYADVLRNRVGQREPQES